MLSQSTSINVDALKAKSCAQEKANVAVEAANVNKATQDDAAKSKCKPFVGEIMTWSVQVGRKYNNPILSCRTFL